MLTLSDLVAPLAIDDFFAHHWPMQAFWDQSSAKRAAIFQDIPELQSAETALSLPGRFGIFTGKGRVETTSDPTEALAAFRRGKTCFLHGENIAALSRVRDSLTGELGLSSDAIRTEIFCSPAESGAQMHCDYDVNFAVLVRGRKLWRIAPNTHVDNPVAQSFAALGEDAGGLTARLANRLPLPTQMPDDAASLTLTDGGMVFVPRGWWHETRTEAECMQVNFAVKSPMWLTVVTKALRNQLLEDPAWRGYALDIFAHGPRQDEAMEVLASLLADLHGRIGELVSDLAGPGAARRFLHDAGLHPADASD